MMLSILLAVLSTPVLAGDRGEIIVTRRSEQAFVNTDCERTTSCALKGASLVLEDYTFWFEDRFQFGTRVFVKYRTGTVGDLETFALVNFIRGCHFESRLENGERRTELAYAVYSGGEVKPFDFARWNIDSVDLDPVYNSPDDASLGRHAYYRWNTVPGSYDNLTQVFYADRKPTLPELYVSDRPGQSSVDPASRRAHNISLEFRMCVYKTGEVPLELPTETIEFAEPLHCFPWRSSFVYDHARRQFGSPDAIDGACSAGGT
jgi:hypothetical protein